MKLKTKCLLSLFGFFSAVNYANASCPNKTGDGYGQSYEPN
jgi:hypothetical protein